MTLAPAVLVGVHQPTVSVVLGSWIESVLAQTVADWELIVVDA
jgi:glycosyltransferase involved in cell wall biosynthesis